MAMTWEDLRGIIDRMTDEERRYPAVVRAPDGTEGHAVMSRKGLGHYLKAVPAPPPPPPAEGGR